MKTPLNIRNLCVIGQTDHGKTTTVEVMLKNAHILDFSPEPIEEPKEGEEGEEEQEEEDLHDPDEDNTATLKAK